uniref:NADH-ubiquinone oxidoreductase chain 5 n=1 Tax=Paralithodes camtschaticus TaxID=6741 RepID=L0GFN4_PARCM|nr:NADH dehydrogenase subunit 5 [Paralithodes camtschaticus]AGA84553.1 NADH dehydrogenase subunit 5 [Paralithodes camtschaticus]
MSLSSMLFLLLLSIFSMMMSLFCILFEKCYVAEWEILSINSNSILATFIFDWMSLMFLGFVLLISSMVIFYSGDYMMGDYNMNRFIYLVLAFVFSMAMLIISPNLISILLGWDGLGLISYALVIYYQNEKSANAGMLTVLSNRIGDVAILLSIGLMFKLGGWNFIFYSYYLTDCDSMMLKLLIMMAAMTKSAQIPFSAWLPAAMAAPTPVSALVHSSTLVTAGVYLMIRFSPSLLGSKVSILLLLISCLTMFMSGLGANFEYDLKKIIALSTLSQLGVMLSILSLGFSSLAFFHLLTHALFKALLFMCAGVVIHNVKEFQDIRYMGSLCSKMPLTSMCMNLANLALCGTPFLAGFYSKDLILEMAFMSWINLVCFILYVVATSLTVCYTFRLVYYSLTGVFNLSSYSAVSDSSYVMTNPMIVLGFGAIFGGAMLSWIIFPESYMICMSLSIKMLTLFISIIGGILGYLLNMMTIDYKLKSLGVYNLVVFMGSMWFMPFISTLNFSKNSLKGGAMFYKLCDKGWSETLGGQGLFNTVIKFSLSSQILQDNGIKVFMKMFLVLSIILLLFII